MALKTYKPTTAGLRHVVLVDKKKDGIYKGRPEQSLTEGLSSSGGRNNRGRITSRGMGGGHKRRYRKIDFKRQKLDVEATVERLEYDPNRTAFIALIAYADGEKSYIIAPQNLSVGDKVVASNRADIKPGNAMPMKNMPVGTIVHNVELKPGKGGQIARSAGCYAQIVGKDAGYAQIRLGSGEMRMVPVECVASVGAVSNQDHQNTTLGKAGRNRWRGVRPITRGIAQNAVDHPNGGRTKGGKHWKSPWGQSAKGLKTRTNKRTTRLIIRTRHQAKAN